MLKYLINHLRLNDAFALSRHDELRIFITMQSGTVGNMIGSSFTTFELNLPLIVVSSATCGWIPSHVFLSNVFNSTNRCRKTTRKTNKCFTTTAIREWHIKQYYCSCQLRPFNYFPFVHKVEDRASTIRRCKDLCRGRFPEQLHVGRRASMLLPK